MEPFYDPDFSFAECGKNALASRQHDGQVLLTHYRDPMTGDVDFECNVIDRETWKLASRIARTIDRYGNAVFVHRKQFTSIAAGDNGLTKITFSHKEVA